MEQVLKDVGGYQIIRDDGETRIYHKRSDMYLSQKGLVGTPQGALHHMEHPYHGEDVYYNQTDGKLYKAVVTYKEI